MIIFHKPVLNVIGSFDGTSSFFGISEFVGFFSLVGYSIEPIGIS